MCHQAVEPPSLQMISHEATKPPSHKVIKPSSHRASSQPPTKIAICRVICEIFCRFWVCWLVPLFVLLRSVAVFALQPPGGNQVDGLLPASSMPVLRVALKGFVLIFLMFSSMRRFVVALLCSTKYTGGNEVPVHHRLPNFRPTSRTEEERRGVKRR